MEIESILGELHRRGRVKASLFLWALSREHDAWLVGGSARWVLGGCRGEFPKDIDVLKNTPDQQVAATSASALAPESSNGQGEKRDVDGVAFDIFQNDLVKWLRGAPCRGDQIAIRLRDNFVLCSPAFFIGEPQTRNPEWNGSDGYFAEHSKHVARDAEFILSFTASLEDSYCPAVHPGVGAIHKSDKANERCPVACESNGLDL